MSGIALSAYFRHNPFTVAEETLMKEDKNYLLPIFVVRQLPLGIRGLVVAAIFAAAISTLQGAADRALASLRRTDLCGRSAGRRGSEARRDRPDGPRAPVEASRRQLDRRGFA